MSATKRYFHGLQRHDVDDVFHQPAQILFANLRYFERVAMQMERVLIAAAVAEDEAISLARMHHERLDVGPRFVVDRPRIEFGIVLWADVAKGQGKSLIWRGSRS